MEGKARAIAARDDFSSMTDRVYIAADEALQARVAAGFVVD